MAEKTDASAVYKIIMIGSGGVGKSALTLQYMYDEFVNDYEPTKADSYRKTVMLDGEKVDIDILDTAGQESYDYVRDSYIRSGEGFLLIFDITDRESFSDVITLHEQILRVKNGDTNIPMILVGNKIDLAETRKITQTEGEEKAASWSIKYVETSAKTKLNVDKVYCELMRTVRPLKQAVKDANTEKGRVSIEQVKTEKGNGCCVIF